MLPVTGATKAALLGTNSHGPLLLAGDDAVFLDLNTLKPVALDGKIIGRHGRYGFDLRVSADGTTFGGIPKGYGPVAFARMTIDGNKTQVASFSSTSHHDRWAQPTADGSLMVMRGGEVYGADGQRISARWLERSTLYPTVDPAWFIAVRFAARSDGDEQSTHVSFCSVADRRVIHWYVGCPVMVPVGNTNSRMSIAGRLHRAEPRFHYIPWAHVLITLGYQNRRVFARRFNVLADLESNSVDYLVVESTPPYTPVARGETFEHTIRVRSNSPVSSFELADGPDGMTISKKGVVRWPIPLGLDAERASALVEIKSKSGEELFHSFDVRIVDEDAANR